MEDLRKMRVASKLEVLSYEWPYIPKSKANAADMAEVEKAKTEVADECLREALTNYIRDRMTSSHETNTDPYFNTMLKILAGTNPKAGGRSATAVVDQVLEYWGAMGFTVISDLHNSMQDYRRQNPKACMPQPKTAPMAIIMDFDNIICPDIKHLEKA